MTLRSLVEAVFFDLVEEGLVADAQDLCGLFAVPAGLLQHLENQLALRFARGRARDVLQRVVPLGRRRGADFRRWNRQMRIAGCGLRNHRMERTGDRRVRADELWLATADGHGHAMARHRDAV